MGAVFETHCTVCASLNLDRARRIYVYTATIDKKQKKQNKHR